MESPWNHVSYYKHISSHHMNFNSICEIILTVEIDSTLSQKSLFGLSTEAASCSTAVPRVNTGHSYIMTLFLFYIL